MARMSTWRCHVTPCPTAGLTQHADDPARAWDLHYLRQHYKPAGRAALRRASPAPRPRPPTPPRRTSWDDQEEATWIDRL